MCSREFRIYPWLYEKHFQADEAPEFVKRVPLGEIQIGVRKGDVPMKNKEQS